ncbi:MAG: PilT/PilU family type 4a pilus ATPase [Longicatena sp.]|jgi:twitching motility protein PilT|uniref:type IV pilus twitching motility protein PilT n=1 Tax=Anaerorhabdus sp. TaxID=1872524 RepID=UPI002FC65B02
MSIQEILEKAVSKNVSDIFIIAGSPISFKVNGSVEPMDENVVHPDIARLIINEIYELNKNRTMEHLDEIGDDDFSFSISGLGRFRASVYYQRGSLSAVLRFVKPNLPNPEELSIPNTVIQFSKLLKGLVLVTGSAGCGKSTTLACIIDEINKTRQSHIVTIEDPIEYLHRHKKSIVSQREIGNDASDYAQALRATLRQAPDVILVGEMRDYETIKIALSAAETGHLVLSTLHTLGAAETINRIIDVFPPEQQRQIQIQLSTVLQAVVSQQLLPTVNEELKPAFEILLTSNAIRTQIRDGKTYQIDNYIATGKQDGMVAMDDSIYGLYKDNMISKDTAITYAVNSEIMEKKIGKI